MDDYSAWAILAFATAAIVLAAALIFVLAWLESTLPDATLGPPTPRREASVEVPRIRHRRRSRGVSVARTV